MGEIKREKRVNERAREQNERERKIIEENFKKRQVVENE